MPEIVDALDHMLLTNEAYMNTGKSPLYADDLIEGYRSQGGVNSDAYPNTDWQKAVLTEPGLQQSHFLTINGRSEEHTSELQSLMRNSYAVFCLQKTKTK